MSYFDDEFEVKQEQVQDEIIGQEEHVFYTEVVRKKKPRKSTLRLIALVLAVGLALGAGFGYGLDSILEGQTPGVGTVYAAGTDNTTIVYDKSVSPVVPIARKVSPAIVAISMKTQSRGYFGDVYVGEGTGSGIIIDNQGHIVTNNHVVEGAKELTVILKDGTELKASLVGRDASTDLAVIKVDAKNLTFAELGDSSKLEVGELAVAFGSPMGTEYAGSVTAGIISGLERKISVGDRNMKLIQTDAAINPGNSGGALVNAEGKVIGINTIKLAQTTVEGMGFAIPINEAKPIIDELIKNKKVARPYLGIQGSTVTKEDAEQYEVPQGVYVQAVIPSSGAEEAGITRGEIITKIDGEKTLTIEDLVAIIRKHKVGDTVKVEVYGKYDKTRTVSIKLRESSE